MLSESLLQGKQLPMAICWLAGFLLLGSTLLQGQTPAQLPAGDGRDLVAAVCTQCHALRPIMMKRDGVGGWRETVQEMVIRGAQLFPEEAETVVRYLAGNFGPGMNPMQTGDLPPGVVAAQPGGAASAIVLPDGPGKDVVEARCTLCHDLGRVVTARRSREEWARITQNMIDRGPEASPGQVQTIVSYLAAQFGRQGE